MKTLSQKIELTANILIICFTVLMEVILAYKFFTTTDSDTRQPEAKLPVGSKINLFDVNWSDQPKTLVLALNKGCRFCDESASFYKQIIETTRNKNVRLIAVLPSDVDSSKLYLNELGLHIAEVKSLPLNKLRIKGTPTLILVNEKGEITDYWVGKLPPNKELEVLNKF